MCGIAGVLSFNDPVDLAHLKNMTDILIHRGPDDEGHWLNDDKSIGLGHRRLSILDLSDSGKQPMHSLNNRYVITFNGEIYNYIELRKSLQKKGYQFHTNTDTEVLLAMYDLKKENCLGDLDGMFAFAIWDKIERKLFCARDRFGEKPFYYYKDKNKFIFASEIKALWTNNIRKEVSNKFIYDYLLYNTLQDNNNMKSSFYCNVYKLEPSHYMTINLNGDLTTNRYWDVKYSKTNYNIKLEHAKEEFLSLFKDSISKRLRSDVAVGSSLSGGLDSSSIVSLIDQLKTKNQPQKTFSARFKDFDRDEGYFIKKVIEKTKGIDPYEIYPTKNSVINNLSKVIYHQDEPFGSMSISAQYEVMKLAKSKNVTVLLDGQGADEFLAGYSTSVESYYHQIYKTDRLRYIQELKSYEKLYNRPFPKINFKNKLKSYSDNTFQKFAHFRRKNLSPNNSYFLGIHSDIVEKNQTNLNPIYKPSNLKEHLHSSLINNGISGLLRYADRNSMANSVEVRLPFLSHHLIEFVFSLPDHFLINNAWTKYILRTSMENILPKEITWRKDKVGFEPPINNWMKDKLFVEMTNDSISKLQRNKIISSARPNLSWQYIMLANYI